jgi:hypothetical protein
VYKGFRVAIDRADLRLTTERLRFAVASLPVDGGDFAPDEGVADYPLSNEALTLQVARFAAPKTVVAGKRFATTLQVLRSDLGELSSAGRVACSGKYGTKAVKVAANFVADRARCSGLVPKAAKGKPLRVTVTFVLDGIRVSRTASIKVR